MTLPSKHTHCLRCHHRNDYKRRSGEQRTHRCHEAAERKVSGKQGSSSIKVKGRQGRPA